MTKLSELSPDWLPDPDAQWWHQKDKAWMALNNVEAMRMLFTENRNNVFARGGDGKTRSGDEELLGCWARPRGSTGTGRWVDQKEAGDLWSRGFELWWGQVLGWECGEPEVEGPVGPPPAKVETPQPDGSPPPNRPVSQDGTFELKGYKFSRINVGGKTVWVGPFLSRETYSLLVPAGQNTMNNAYVQPRDAAETANIICKLIGCGASTTHAYNIDSYYTHCQARPDQEAHVRIASPAECVGYWRTQTSLPDREEKIWSWKDDDAVPHTMTFNKSTVDCHLGLRKAHNDKRMQVRCVQFAYTDPVHIRQR
jgi:hypothetical protein